LQRAAGYSRGGDDDGNLAKKNRTPSTWVEGRRCGGILCAEAKILMFQDHPLPSGSSLDDLIGE